MLGEGMKDGNTRHQDGTKVENNEIDILIEGGHFSIREKPAKETPRNPQG